VGTIDLKRVYKEQYTAGAGKPALVTVPERPFLMIDGEGDPNTVQEYVDAIEALYPIAYAIRAEIKKATGDGYTVLPLEGLWWADDMESFSAERKHDWMWTMMIGLPELLTPAQALEAIRATTTVKGLVAGERVRYERYDEGPSAQVMHVGPYSEEAPTIDLLHEFIDEQGLQLRGLHHEIYLGDPRKTDPARLRTIIRQPVA